LAALKYANQNNVNCDCRETQTMEHILTCSLSGHTTPRRPGKFQWSSKTMLKHLKGTCLNYSRQKKKNWC